MLFELLVVLVELTKLVWKDVGIWNKVKMLLAESFLHSYDVEAKTVFSRDFMTLRPMVNFLVFVEAFVEIAFAT